MIISVQLALGPSPAAQQTTQGAPTTTAPQPGRGLVDSRVQQRTYTFADTNETMPYALVKYEYKEYPGVTHGPIMAASMADIYAFFAKHSKSTER